MMASIKSQIQTASKGYKENAAFHQKALKDLDTHLKTVEKGGGDKAAKKQIGRAHV